MYNVEGTWWQPEVHFRQESDTLGFHFRFGSHAQKLEFKPAIEFDPTELPPLEKQWDEVRLDLDYFTTADTPSNLFRAPQWIEEAMHAIRRDSRAILEANR
jgi:hypothetical protein